MIRPGITGLGRAAEITVGADGEVTVTNGGGRPLTVTMHGSGTITTTGVSALHIIRTDDVGVNYSGDASALTIAGGPEALALTINATAAIAISTALIAQTVTITAAACTSLIVDPSNSVTVTAANLTSATVVNSGGTLQEATFAGCALTAASVDSIINACAAGTAENGTLNLGGVTNAAPTAASASALATLLTRSWTVTHN